MQEDTMKKPVSPGLIAGIAVALVLVLAFIGYKTFASSNTVAPTAQQTVDLNKSAPTQGASYNQQIQNRPKPGSGNGYGSQQQQYSQQMQQGMRR